MPDGRVHRTRPKKKPNPKPLTDRQLAAVQATYETEGTAAAAALAKRTPQAINRWARDRSWETSDARKARTLAAREQLAMQTAEAQAQLLPFTVDVANTWARLEQKLARLTWAAVQAAEAGDVPADLLDSLRRVKAITDELKIDQLVGARTRGLGDVIRGRGLEEREGPRGQLTVLFVTPPSDGVPPKIVELDDDGRPRLDR